MRLFDIEPHPGADFSLSLPRQRDPLCILLLFAGTIREDSLRHLRCVVEVQYIRQGISGIVSIPSRNGIICFLSRRQP